MKKREVLHGPQPNRERGPPDHFNPHIILRPEGLGLQEIYAKNPGEMNGNH